MYCNIIYKSETFLQAHGLYSEYTLMKCDVSARQRDLLLDPNVKSLGLVLYLDNWRWSKLPGINVDILYNQLNQADIIEQVYTSVSNIYPPRRFTPADLGPL
jgi:hypothetical protein